MSNELAVTVGQYSDKGRKERNQDFYGICVPKKSQLATKGIAIALADGISSSDVGQVASEAAVTGFLEDYYCTSDAWSVKKSVERVLTATNSWLYSQTMQSQHRYDKNKGFVCTLSALVIKSNHAHIFHVGDARIYRLRDSRLEQLTTDHRLWVSEDKSYLSRALGVNAHLEIDYESHQVCKGDVFLLATDGVYDYASPRFMINAVLEHGEDYEAAATAVALEAFRLGSTDNLTVQLVRIDELPDKNVTEVYQQLTNLPFPPDLEPRMMFDGYQLIRELHVSSRSRVYLALDTESNVEVALKIPSVELREDPAYLERFLLEEWIARRVNNAHVLRPCNPTRQPKYIYLVMEFIHGQTLAQWMRDNPSPELETVRKIVEQLAKGIRAFHRLEMIHQDIKPDNIMIDTSGTVKIIDFGSTKVAGFAEISSPIEQHELRGSAQYAAPEYFLGNSGTTRSDIFSVGVVAYQMLCGKLPYGAGVAKTRTRAEQKKLRFAALPEDSREIPIWVEGALKKALHTDPRKRYQVFSEFLYDLRHPNKQFVCKSHVALLERDPLLVWKCIAVIQSGLIVALLWSDL